ncbi:MAG: DUF1365 domain-containing protein [Phycisphaerales bacterium]|nr:MAG: DUF1365 domain-containing protein [Phycisphaerales bacterium]
MLSCIYEGHVRHRRLSPAEHRFRYGLFLVYLDLEELPSLFQRGVGLSRARFSPASYCRQDHLGDPAIALADSVRGLVRDRTGWASTGPIRLLTLPRCFGYYFNPLSLYYCFDITGDVVEAVVAEVTNTPWLERHWYVLWEGNRVGRPSRLRFRHAKGFHVSPFMGMDADYDWRLSRPGPRLSVCIDSSRSGRRFFDVTMVLRRRELNRRSMARVLLRHPWMTMRVSQAIYWQAARLWWKNSPFFPHPKHRTAPAAEEP